MPNPEISRGKRRIPIITSLVERRQAAQARTDAEQVARLDAYVANLDPELAQKDYPQMRRKLLKRSVMDNPRDIRKKKKLLARVERYEAHQRQNKAK